MYYNYTVILTYGGMLIAFYGILSAINQEFWNSIFCLMLAGICDMFDGTVAATKERTASEKRFGIQIDSLSEFCSLLKCLESAKVNMLGISIYISRQTILQAISDNGTHYCMRTAFSFMPQNLIILRYIKHYTPQNT